MVMRCHFICHLFVRIISQMPECLPDDLSAFLGMCLHNFKLFICQFPRLLQNCIRYRDLADIMHWCRHHKICHIIICQLLLIKTAASKFLCQQFHIRSCTADMPSRIVITVLHQCCKPHHHLFIVFLEFRIERCLLIQINSHDHNRRNQTRQQCLREKHLICRHPDCH